MIPIPPVTRSIELEIEIDRLRLHAARDRAEEVIRDYGWTEEDDDFWMQVEDETKRQWNEEIDREWAKMMLWEEELFDELSDEAFSQ